jgi:hypothetical protein
MSAKDPCFEGYTDKKSAAVREDAAAQGENTISKEIA